MKGNSNYTPPKGESTLGGAGPKPADSAGVASGLSEHMAFDSENHGPMTDYTVDPVTDNAPERVKPEYGEKVSAKGKKFTVC